MSYDMIFPIECFRYAVICGVATLYSLVFTCKKLLFAHASYYPVFTVVIKIHIAYRERLVANSVKIPLKLLRPSSLPMPIGPGRSRTSSW